MKHSLSLRRFFTSYVLTLLAASLTAGMYIVNLSASRTLGVPFVGNMIKSAFSDGSALLLVRRLIGGFSPYLSLVIDAYLMLCHLAAQLF